MVSTVAGSAEVGYHDGLGTEAKFFWPWGIACDADGNIYVADKYNHVIRRVTPEGMVSTVAGVPGEWGYKDGFTYGVE